MMHTGKAQWTGTVLRILIGTLFIYMGLSKALDLVDFLKLVRQYNLPLHYLMLNSVAATLPWFEVICGVLLLLGTAVRGTALLMVTMLVPFTIVVLLRALEIADAQNLGFCAVKFDCGCGAGEVLICAKLIENTILTAAAVWLVCGYGRPLAARYSLFGPRS